MDELTDPDPALLEPTRPDDNIGRTAAALTGWNLVSRMTGFVRVIATAGALGIAALGDSYQSASLVSNVLFELLAGGLLFSVLVPTFVGMIDRGRRDETRVLAGVLLARALAVLAVLVVVTIALGPLVMRGLTLGVSDPVLRQQQINLGSFLLWFIMPQLLLYAVGAVSTALLQADRKFVAAAVAPVFNNLVVIATMLTFAALHDPASGIHLTTGEKVLLGAGTLAGTIAMTFVPVVASHRSRIGPRPRWSDPQATGLGALARKGLWGAGDIGLNQVMILATVVYAGRVSGGVIAFQTAFIFFLLPHAILAHPIFTTLFPRLSAHGSAGDMDAFAADVSAGLRAMFLLLVPAAAMMAVMAMPVLTVVRRGAFTEQGVELVASVLAAYMVGLVGYSAFFLLTRASYALDDVRSPTMVYMWATLGAIVMMGVASGLASGNAQVVVLGLVHGAAVTLGSLGLYLRLRRRTQRPMPVFSTAWRAALATLVGAGAAWLLVSAIGWDSRGAGVMSILVGGVVGIGLVLLVLVAMRTPELNPVMARLDVRRRRQGSGPS